jgi:anti-anti-sigma factor
MVHDQGEIPLVGRIGPESSAAGLHLVATRPRDSAQRRIEDWIASNLDLPAETKAPNRWEQLVGKLPGLRRPGANGSGRHVEGRQVRSIGAWSRFQVAYRRGITVVRLVDQTLVQRSHIRELGDDLTDLIAVGNHRIILNFAAVERLGSWIVGVVGNAHRRCAGVEGGRLKVCGLEPQLADIFTIVGMAGQLEMHPGEAEAVDSPWPCSSSCRALPVDIMAALTSSGDLRPVCGGAPEQPAGAAVRVSGPSRSSSGVEAARQVWLHLQAGPSGAREVLVTGARFVIGREQGCQLRIGSAHVSKQHAAIRRREGNVFLEDLGSTNGTTVNGRPIRGREVQLHEGDRIMFGPLAAVLSIEPAREAGDTVGEHAAEWVHPEAGAPVSLASEAPSTAEMSFPEELDPEGRIKCEVIQDVLVITPQLPELDDEATNDALRHRLIDLYEQPLPRRVVVNLEFVNHLSRQTIAILLAHHFRLDRAGGALRICQAHARIIAMLDQVRLTMLVDCYPTLDEAVLAIWATAPGASSPSP